MKIIGWNAWSVRAICQNGWVFNHLGYTWKAALLWRFYLVPVPTAVRLHSWYTCCEPDLTVDVNDPHKSTLSINVQMWHSHRLSKPGQQQTISNTKHHHKPQSPHLWNKLPVALRQPSLNQPPSPPLETSELWWLSGG